jgi:hypothetical protein
MFRCQYGMLAHGQFPVIEYKPVQPDFLTEAGSLQPKPL